MENIVLAHVVKSENLNLAACKKREGKKKNSKWIYFKLQFFKAINYITGMDALLVYVFLHTDPKALFMKGVSLIFFSPEVKKIFTEQRLFSIRSKVFKTFAVTGFKGGPKVLLLSQKFEGL